MNHVRELIHDYRPLPLVNGRKAAPSGMFDRIQSGQFGASGNLKQGMGISKTIFPCLA